MRKKTRVRIDYTLEVDVDGWANEYSISTDAVPEDVRVYFAEIPENLPDHLRSIVRVVGSEITSLED